MISNPCFFLLLIESTLHFATQTKTLMYAEGRGEGRFDGNLWKGYDIQVSIFNMGYVFSSILNWVSFGTIVSRLSEGSVLDDTLQAERADGTG